MSQNVKQKYLMRTIYIYEAKLANIIQWNQQSIWNQQRFNGEWDTTYKPEKVLMLIRSQHKF